MPRLLIAGCGFLGESAAGFFSTDGWEVVPLTASAESAARLREKFPAATQVDISSPESVLEVRKRLGAFDAVLHCASSGRGGAGAYRTIYFEGMTNLAEVFPDARLIFTSSTSVYPQTDGSWVDETSPTTLERETGLVLLKAEDIALAAAGNALRLSGIYGPGRSVLLRKFREGSAVLEEGGLRWINQIHRDDAARAVFAVAKSRTRGEIYNVTDDTPAPQHEVYGWIADFLGQPMPPEGPADLNRKRGWTSKRVSNAKLRALGWAPRFPSYRAALFSPGAVDS